MAYFKLLTRHISGRKLRKWQSVLRAENGIPDLSSRRRKSEKHSTKTFLKKKVQLVLLV